MPSFAFRSTLARALPVLAASAAAGCAAPAPDSGPPEHVGAAAAAITASDAIGRAEQWVTAELQYCQSPNGADDSIDPACSPVCMRQSNPQWDPYRSDCSGLVSWAWGLPAPGRTTAEFAPNQSDITSEIQAADLAPGDAVNTDDSVSNEHHIMLFKLWTVPGQEATFIEEPGCSSNPDYAHEFTSSVTTNGTSITVAYNGITFHAIRYVDLEQGPIYAASYVSQSWPLSNAAPIQMIAGQAQKGSIDLKNTGTATWPAGVVKLAPIPRDKPSDFHAPSWLSPSRVSTVSADVPPGGVGHFEWDLDPSQPGMFMPYFGLVAEGVTWFADSGGPPDNDIQVNVAVAPAPPTGSSSSGSGTSAVGDATGAGGSTGAGFGGGAGAATDNGGCEINGAGRPASGIGAALGLLAALGLTRRARPLAIARRTRTQPSRPAG